MVLEFQRDFWSDLEKIDGKGYEHWRATLIFRLWDFKNGDGLPKIQHHGGFIVMDQREMELSSGEWRPGGFRAKKIRLWYLHQSKPRRMLFAEHEATLNGRMALDVARMRAEEYDARYSQESFEAV